MIGNLDWSMRAAPDGQSCCHNFKLMAAAPAARTELIPVPYDFDSAGLVNAPYAVAPNELGAGPVRTRHYRGYCMHNAAVAVAAADFRAKRSELFAVFGSIPELDGRSRRDAVAYLASFFREIATDEDLAKRVLKSCIN
jgi:hypothetical protein